MRVLLAGHPGLFAISDEAGCGLCVGGVALVRVGLDDRSAVHPHFVAGFVGVREVRVVGMGHVGADEEAARHRTLPVFFVQLGMGTDAGQHVGDEAAAGTRGALAADLLVIEQGRHTGGGRLFGRDQRGGRAT